jgi:hypothetical protein
MINHNGFNYYVERTTGKIDWYDYAHEDDRIDYIVATSLRMADIYSMIIVKIKYINESSCSEYKTTNGKRAALRVVLGNEDLVYIDEVEDLVDSYYEEYPEEFI